MTQTQTYCYYVPGSTDLIDTIAPGETTTSLGLTSGDIAEQYPNAILINLDDAIAAITEIHRKPPKQITPGKWNEMLNILPPLHWVSSRTAETFKLREFTWGTITAIFCRVGEHYWELTDSYTLQHDTIVEICTATLSKD